MTSNARRITNELRFFREDPPANCTAGFLEDTVYQWLCTVSGPANTDYANQQF